MEIAVDSVLDERKDFIGCLIFDWGNDNEPFEFKIDFKDLLATQDENIPMKCVAVKCLCEERLLKFIEY